MICKELFIYLRNKKSMTFIIPINPKLGGFV